MRTHSLRGQDATLSHWFITSEHQSWNRRLVLWPRESDESSFKKIQDFTQRSRWSSEESGKDLAEKKNLSWLLEKNPRLKDDEHDKVHRLLFRVESVLRQNGEVGLFSILALSSFLEQSDHQRYGDFLDDQWDRLYEDMISSVYSVNEEIFKLTPNVNAKSLFYMRPRSKPEVQKVLEDLTLEQVKALLALREPQLRVTPSTIQVHVSTLLRELDGPKELTPISSLEETFFDIFLESMKRHSSSSRLSNVKLTRIFLSELEHLPKSFYAKPNDAKMGKLPSSVLKRF